MEGSAFAQALVQRVRRAGASLISNRVVPQWLQPSTTTEGSS